MRAERRRWLVTGARGMLGTDLVAALRAAGQAVSARGSDALDVRDPVACADAVGGHDIVVNCAAWTAVDEAEQCEAEAFAVNAVGPANLAAACSRGGARLVQISTDYVFDGTASEPYPEDAPIAPCSAYGRTKAAGEWAARCGHDDVLVVRTAWLYGAHGGCFPRTIARALTQRETLDVVNDQVGQPTWTVDVATLVLALVAHEAAPGVYHATSAGRTSWHGFAQAVAEDVGADPARVRETVSASVRRPASRPAYSVLGHDAILAAGLRPIGPWRERFTAATAGVLADL